MVFLIEEAKPCLIRSKYIVSKNIVNYQETGKNVYVPVIELGQGKYRALYNRVVHKPCSRQEKYFVIPNENAKIKFCKMLNSHKDMGVFDEAFAIKNYILKFGYTQMVATKYLGLSQSAISNKLRLLNLSDEEKRLCVKYKFTEHHIRLLLSIKDPIKRSEIIEYIHSQELTVQETEVFLTKFSKNVS